MAWTLTGLRQTSPHWNPGGTLNPRVGDTVEFRMLPVGTPANPQGILLPEFRKLLYHAWKVVRPDGTSAPFRIKPISARNGRGTDHKCIVTLDQDGEWRVKSECWKQGGEHFVVIKAYVVKKR